MKPRIFTVTIARNEDRVIGATLQAWWGYAEKSFVIDTGSIDNTWAITDFTRSVIVKVNTLSPEGAGAIRTFPGSHIEISKASLDVGASMVARQELIDRIPKEPGCWMLTLDADEVWPESQIRALLARLEDPEIDFVAVRPVALGQDCASMYAPYYFEPEKIEDRANHTTEHWCDKWSTRCYRASRGITVSDARWGCEVYSCEIDPFRDTLTPDFKEEPVPAHHTSTMYTGRTAWTDIYFLHLTNFTRSTKWAEIPQIPGSNAMDRARWRSRGRVGQFQFPYNEDIPESVMAIASGER